MDRRWWTPAAVCAAVFMLLLDITIVSVVRAIDELAGPDRRRSRSAEQTSLALLAQACHGSD